MLKSTKKTRMKKELKLWDVYAIATGATLSAGFFLLPGIAAQQAGSALVLAYLLAAIPMIPAMFSVIELATAMPRAGGVYFFLDRALGPFLGCVGGIGTWLALVLKVTFALVGMGAYIALFIPDVAMTPIAIVIAVVLALLNLVGTKKSGGFQIVLVMGLLSILTIFFFSGFTSFQPMNFQGFWGAGFDTIIATAGMVYISYVGVTKVASLSEEVKNPEKVLPKAVIMSLVTAVIVYFLGTMMIVGLVSPEKLAGSLTPVAEAAGVSMGRFGVILVSIAAMFAFLSVANAGMMSASRYPLAMSRDHLLPRRFRELGKHGTPVYSIGLTLGVMVAILILFDPMGIAKLASAFQLFIFALVCLAVIVMRESKIDSYDPGYKSPFYPWMQLLGIIAPCYLIFEMGALSIGFSVGLIIVSSLWYHYYGKRRVARSGAIYHVFERLGHHRHTDLDTELRGILREKGLREEDPFDEIVMRSLVFDLDGEFSFEGVIKLAAYKIKGRISMSAEEIVRQVNEGTKVGATPVTRGVALPHFRTSTIEQSEMVLIRCRNGIKMSIYDALTHEESDEVIIHAIFFLVSPESNPTQHLRVLARIAERVDEDSFVKEWENAKDEAELRASLLHDDHFFSFILNIHDSTASLIDKRIQEAAFPKGCLVAMLTRDGQTFVPNGRMELKDGDELTLIGDNDELDSLRAKYG